MSVITRWGTQYRLISSLLRSKDALRRYAEVHKAKDLGHDAFEYICDNTFWAELEILREILKPIDEKLKMSESSKSHLGHVMNRWNDIVDHLHRKATAIPELIDFLEQSDDDITGTKGAFHRRYNRQVTTIHTVAYFLMPENRQVQIPVVYERPIYNFFRQYTNSQTEYETICEEFQAFRSQQAPFESIRVCWDHIQKPKVFWSHQGSYTSMIGTLAKRIFSTPVNSVASERAFSIQNLIHTKLRNCLQSERVNKLTFAYMNARVLRSIEQKLTAQLVHSLTPEEELALEEAMLVEEQEEEGAVVEMESEESAEE